MLKSTSPPPSSSSSRREPSFLAPIPSHCLQSLRKTKVTNHSELTRPVYAGANYFILGRTLYYVPYLSPIHPGRVVSTFIGLDVLVEILTGSGAPKVVNLDNPGQIAIGAALIKAALVMQLGIFLGFVAVAVTFHVRCVSANVFGHKIQTVMYVLYVSTALILTRSVYRTVEYFEGYGGYLGAHEAFFWVFEASLMLVNSVLLNVWHPGRYLPRSNNVYLSRDGVTEAVGPGWVDKRHFLVTIVDPFDIVGLIRGKDKETAFWEVEGRREGGFDGVTLSASERSKQPTTHTIATPSGDRV